MHHVLMQAECEVMTFQFKDAGDIPNHPSLPLVVIKRGVDLEGDDPGAIFERLYPQGGWRAAWRWGVYDFPHYHSTAHEVLGCYRGSARLQLGHSTGVDLMIEPSDVLIIPAGVGHQNLGSSGDFHVVGGYPVQQQADILHGKPDERPRADENIARVPLPKGDPIFGSTGPLHEHWNL